MAKARQDIITDSQNRYTYVPSSITPNKHIASDTDLAEGMEHILEGAKLVEASFPNSDQLKFDWYKGYIHGSESLPLSGDLTVDLTGALAGAGVIVFHNDSIEPNISGAIKRNYSYAADSVNILLFLNLNGFVIVSSLAGSGEPYATDVVYNNTSPVSNDPVTLSYSFNDLENDPEGVTLFQHYIETGVGTGVFEAIPGATLADYTPTAGQIGLRLQGEVVVVSQNPPFQGQPVRTLPTNPIGQGAFIPTDIASLITWANLRDINTVNYSGSPEKVNSVDDSSGNTNFWSPGNGGTEKPLYDTVNNWAEFDGTDMTLRVDPTKDLAIAQDAARTFFIVFSGNNPGPTEHYGLFVVDGFNNKYTLHHTSNGIGIRDTLTTYWYFSAQSSLLFDGNLHVLGIRQSTANGLKLQLDAHTATDAVNTPFSFPLSTPAWGRNVLEPEGTVREILIFNDYLSDSDFNNVFSYLETQNGL